MTTSKQHYAKEKFGGGVLPEDYYSPQFQGPSKLAHSGIGKVLSEKGWSLTTTEAKAKYSTPPKDKPKAKRKTKRKE